MTSYTIVITSSDVTQASTVFTLDMNSSERQITEVSVCFGANNTPLPVELTTFDFRPILGTVALLSRGQLPNFCLSTADESSTVLSAESLGRGAGDQHSGSNSPSLETTRTPSQKKPSMTDQVTRTSRTRRGDTPPRKTKAQREDMPSDLAVVYWREGTIAKVADHYSVPRYIAQRWIKLLRQGGTVPDPWPGQQPRSKLPSRTRKPEH
jgi:hypothetical protein